MRKFIILLSITLLIYILVPVAALAYNSSIDHISVITDGTAQVGELVNFSFEHTSCYSNISMIWKADDQIVSTSIDSYRITQSDVGKQITLTLVLFPEGFNRTSAPTEIVTKADNPTTPLAPTIGNKTYNTIALNQVEGYEYSVVIKDAPVDNSTWQTSNLFTSLCSNTTYDCYQRITDTKYYAPSAISSVLTIATDCGPYTISYDPGGGNTISNTYLEGIVFSLHDGTEFTRDNFIIDGWIIESTLYPLSALLTMPSKNATACAVWVADSDNDGISNHDELAAGTNPDNPYNTPKNVTLSIELIDSYGNPKSGVVGVLNSSPTFRISGENGKLTFSDVPLTNHLLSIRQGNSQTGTYIVSVVPDTGDNYIVNIQSTTNSADIISIVSSDNLLTLDLSLFENLPSNWQLSDVTTSHK